MELPACFLDGDGAVVVNFGIFTGREATIAEVDRLAHSVWRAGGKEISIVASRTHEYRGSLETVIHQVVARSDGIDADELEGLCTLWVRDCAADRHLTPL
jgi:hypothetical protein